MLLKMPKMVVEMSELSKDEMEMVTTVHFTPATSVTEWLLRKDSAFRTTVAQILSATEFPVSGPVVNNKLMLKSVVPQRGLYSPHSEHCKARKGAVGPLIVNC